MKRLRCNVPIGSIAGREEMQVRLSCCHQDKIYKENKKMQNIEKTVGEKKIILTNIGILVT
jgi:hypothetical protein